MRKMKNLGKKVVKTMAEVGLTYLTLGMTLTEVDWIHMLSAMIFSAIYTLLFNLKDLKVEEDE